MSTINASLKTWGLRLAFLTFVSVSRAFVPAAVVPTKSSLIVPHYYNYQSRAAVTQFRGRAFHMSAPVEPRKAGVASPEELREFVSQAGSRLLVVDLRNPNASVEPGDQTSLAVAPVPSPPEVRPQATHLIFDRNTNSMPLPEVEKDTPIITHCGGGGRGELAKDYLMQHGFTNVLNGGGPKEKECWAEFGHK